MEASTLRLPARALGPAVRRLSGDEALVAGVRAGESGAFESVFERYHRPLLSFCRHMLGSREEAEDAVQQTFMAAYRNLSASTKPILLRPWLYTIARNNCLSMLRARRENVPLDDVTPATEGLASEVQRREDLRQMLADLAHLPDDQRAALVLAELGSLPHHEIADVVGCSRDKVKALIFQARSSLSASRSARETPCDEVREQLSTLIGGALRRSRLRRHIRQCPGCRAFESEVRRQRSAMAILLPVVPTLGFKDSVLGAVGLNAAGGAGIGAAGAGAGSVGLGGTTKLIAIALVSLGAGAGGIAMLTDGATNAPADSSPPARSTSASVKTAGRSSARPEPRARSLASAQAARRRAARGRAARAASRSGSSTDTATRTRGGDRSSRSGGKGSSDQGQGSGKRGSSHGQPLAPGQAGTSPGRAGTTPGQSDKTPAQGSPPPGQSGNSPGQSGSTPGQSGSNPGGGNGGGEGRGTK